MIRIANAGDLPELRAIWNACFAEDVGFGVFFFSELYKPEQTIVFECPDGRVTSMVHMLPYKRSDGTDVTYLYGVGTLPEFRRQGQSAALIREALRLNRICFLIPQEEWLFGFYEKFGFKTFFYKRKFTAGGSMRRASASDIPQLDAIYRDALDISVERTETHWSHILQGEVLIGNGGYAIMEGDCVTEAFGANTSFEMTNIPFAMANEWAGESNYLNQMYN